MVKAIQLYFPADAGSNTEAESNVLEEVIEPYLLQQGLIQRTPRGRMVTGKGFAYLGLPMPAEAAAAAQFDFLDAAGGAPGEDET